ncbi:MAG TPA: hypothetical protein VNK89_04105 [Thermoflexus sp.]|nr:hypothetical protein [Thermoflexus sp.]
MSLQQVPRDWPWVRMTMGAAEVWEDAEGLWLVLLPSSGDRYADAQLDDYEGARFAWRPPVRLTVEARFSRPAEELVGTAGFGFWNAGAMPGAFTGLPSAVWFFFASPPSHVALDPSDPGRGWLAMVWRSPGGWRFPFPIPLARALQRLLERPGLSRAAIAAGRRWMAASQRSIPIDLTQWHRYDIRWRRAEVIFEVDGEEVQRVPFAPGGPLGFVAWIDNQYLRIDPFTGLSGGFLSVLTTQALVLRRVEIQPEPSS